MVWGTCANTRSKVRSTYVVAGFSVSHPFVASAPPSLLLGTRKGTRYTERSEPIGWMHFTVNSRSLVAHCPCLVGPAYVRTSSKRIRPIDRDRKRGQVDHSKLQLFALLRPPRPPKPPPPLYMCSDRKSTSIIRGAQGRKE